MRGAAVPGAAPYAQMSELPGGYGGGGAGGVGGQQDGMAAPGVMKVPPAGLPRGPAAV